MGARISKTKQNLYLKVHTRTGDLIDEEVDSITSHNDKGEFDVLPEHIQFISLIKKNIKVTKLDGTNLVIPVTNAIMRVKGVDVEVFLGIKN